MRHCNFNKIFVRRVGVAAVIVSVMSAGLIANLMILQIEKRGHYSSLAESNRLQFEAVAPPRGILYERNGKVLATNRTLYRLEITPSLVDDMDRTLAELQEIITLDAHDLARFKHTLGNQPPFRNAVLKANLTERELAMFAVDWHRFNGVKVIGELGRHYLHREAFAHAVDICRAPAGALQISIRGVAARYTGGAHAGGQRAGAPYSHRQSA